MSRYSSVLPVEGMEEDITPQNIARLLNGLGELNHQDAEVLSEINFVDLLTSPNPNTSATQRDFENSMEVDAFEQEDGPAPSSEMLHSAPNAANVMQHDNDPPWAPPTQCLPSFSSAFLTSGHATQQGSGGTSDFLDEINPTMRLGSTEARRYIDADPSALQEKLGSIELRDTHRSGQDVELDSELLHRCGEVSSTWNIPARDPAPAPAPAPLRPADREVVDRPAAPDSTSKKGAFMANYQLPDFHHFKVRVSFMSSLILEETVTHEHGCLLYHGRSVGQVGQTDATNLHQIPISTLVKRQQEDGQVVEEEFKWVKEKQKRFTEIILRNLTRGVELRTSEGNIYAKRKSDTKLFWASTQSSDSPAQELRRGEDTQIFNWTAFHTDLSQKYAEGRNDTLRLPAVWISFAQKWDTGSCAVNTKLVWARIEPIRAREMIRAVNPSVVETSTLESFHTSNLQMSYTS